jgi:hypothetical protein
MLICKGARDSEGSTEDSEDKMKNFKKQIYVLAGIACFGIPSTAMATVVGAGSIANCAGGGVFVDATHITWSPTGTLGSGFGCFGYTAGSPALSYSGGPIPNGDAGNIKNLVLGVTSGDQFLTFNGTALDFVLTGFTSPTPTNGTNCSGLTSNQSCIVSAGSPFLLTNNGTGTAITLTANGTVLDGTTANWSLFFTTQLSQSALAIQDLILGIGETAGGIGVTTYSGELTVTPEPGTVSMFLIGGVALLGIGRRLRKV